MQRSHVTSVFIYIYIYPSHRNADSIAVLEDSYSEVVVNVMALALK